MRIAFESSASQPRRWCVVLAERLEAQGHEVVLDRRTRPDGAPLRARLDLLFMLERLLYGIAGPGPSQPAAWPPRLAQRDHASCDLAIDFDGKAVAGAVDVPTLTPLYDGAPDEAAAMDAILDGRAPRLSLALRDPGDGAVRSVATALPALPEPEIFTLSFDRVLSRMGTLLAQAVERFAAGRLDVLGQTASPASGSPTPGALRPLAFLAKSLAAKIGRRLTHLTLRQDHWRIAWRWPAGDEVSSRLAWPSAPYVFLPDDARRFYADPFVLWHGGVAHVFCEEYPYATGKGVISVFNVERDGASSPPRIVLERPYHLSYPMVFARDGAFFMIPETSANRTIEIYRASRFPDEWVLENVLVQGVSAADATLVERGGRLWLFAALAEAGASSWDALGLFHATKLMGPWTPHAANPVLVDAGSARPGGMMFERDGALIRPAQDCRGGYGSALTLCRVDRLDPEHYAQTMLARLAPHPSWRADGVHTLNAAGGLEVIDCVGWRSRRA
ncbi:MAG: formyl transferase [Hyphomicrobiales bacterium]